MRLVKTYFCCRDSLPQDGDTVAVLLGVEASPGPLGAPGPRGGLGHRRVSDRRHHPRGRVPAGPGQAGRVRGAGVRGAGADLALSAGQVRDGERCGDMR